MDERRGNAPESLGRARESYTMTERGGVTDIVAEITDSDFEEEKRAEDGDYQEWGGVL